MLAVIILFLGFSFQAFAHGDEVHPQQEEEEWETIKTEVSNEQLEIINRGYLKLVKPIFKNKCLDCHGVGNQKPWYFVLPGAKQLMTRDIEEAKEHMDMSKDFPFSGHGSPKEDLEAIERTLREDTMPPWQYKIMHWSSGLTKSEEKIIKQWTTNGINLIKGVKK